MRIGLLGDVHTDDVMLERALDLMTETDLSVDVILCTGDLADGPGSLDRCCRLLAEHNVKTVRGNHDRWLIEGRYRDGSRATKPSTIQQITRDYVTSLPATRTIETPAGRVLLCHGLGEDDLFRLPEATPTPEVAAQLDDFVRTTDVRWVVNGHVHRAFARTWRGVVFINAGTVWRKFVPVALILELTTETVICIQLDPDPTAAVHTTTSAVREFKQPIVAR